MATNLAAQSISPLIGLGGRIIVGIDPGAANLGLCAVEVTSGSALYMAGDVIDGSLSPSKIADEVLHFVEITHPDRIAIEDMTTRFVRPQVAMALLLTARIAGYVAGYLHARGHAVDQVSVYDWKKAICGVATATDQQVAHALVQIQHVQAVPKRWSNHVRDACGLAIFAGRV